MKKPTLVKSIIALFAGVAVWGVIQAPWAYAEETTGEKIQANGRETKTAVKKQVRRVKKSVRDATGNSDKVEDGKDTLRNARDESSDKFKEVKNKVD